MYVSAHFPKTSPMQSQCPETILLFPCARNHGLSEVLELLSLLNVDPIGSFLDWIGIWKSDLSWGSHEATFQDRLT